MLPATAVSIRMIGDTSDMYWSAASEDGVHLVLETDERVLWTGRYDVRGAGAGRWELPDTMLVVTDRRFAFLTTQFDTGGGWAGFGVVGLAVATTANVVSRSRAAERSAGKVAIGQVRYEWLAGIALRRVRALIGITDTYIDLMVPTRAGPVTLTLWGRPMLTEEFARWLVAVAAAHRLMLPVPRTAAQTATLTGYGHGTDDPPATGKRTELTWNFPDDILSLICVAAPLAARRAAGGTATPGDRRLVGLCRYGVHSADPETLPTYDEHGRLLLQESESVLWQGSAAAVVTASAVAAGGREAFRTMWSSAGSTTTVTLTDRRIVYGLRGQPDSTRWTVAGQVHHRHVISVLALDGSEYGSPDVFRSVATLIDPPDTIIRVELIFPTRSESCDAAWIRAIATERMASLPGCAASEPAKWAALQQLAHEPSYQDGHYGPVAQLPLLRMLGSDTPH